MDVFDTILACIAIYGLYLLADGLCRIADAFETTASEMRALRELAEEE